jgi:hypothetical protein
MRSQPVRSEASQQRAEGQFKTKKKADAAPHADNTRRQAEADKTMRLRALRLAKEAVDKEAATREAAAALARKAEPRRRVPRPRGSDAVKPT